MVTSILGLTLAGCGGEHAVAVSKQQVVGTWTDQQGRWIVLNADGDSYMDPALENEKHVPIPAASGLAPYFAGQWYFTDSATTVQISYVNSWNTDPGPVTPLGDLTWCTFGSKIELVYGADPDGPCGGLTFKHARRGASS